MVGGWLFFGAVVAEEFDCFGFTTSWNGRAPIRIWYNREKASAKATAPLTKVNGFRRRRPWLGNFLNITTKKLSINSHITNLPSVL
jgi:hypothetical protein